MALEIERLLDETGWHILEALQENARLSFSELGQRVGLSSPAVAERVRRMEDAGIITGYRAEVNIAKIGYPITAIMRLNPLGERCSRLNMLVREMPEILECYRVTGEDCHVMKVVVSSVEHLESLIDRLSVHGQVTTSIVLSTPVTRRIVTRVEENAYEERAEAVLSQ